MVIKLNAQWETDQPFNLLSWGHWFTFANLLLAMFFSIFYLVDHTVPSTVIGWLYLLMTWIGHFAFLSFSCFILTIFPVVVLFPYKRHIRGISAVMASIFQLYLVLDILAYRGLGYHLSSSSFNQISEMEDVYVAQMGDSYFVLLLITFMAILAFQFLASNFTWKRIHSLQNFKKKKWLAVSLVSGFFISHLLHIWGDATLNSDVAKQASMFPAHYPLTAKTLLARYELIDLEEYRSSKFNRALVNSDDSYDEPTPFLQTRSVSCEVNGQANLQIVLVPHKYQTNVAEWLNIQNIKFDKSKQLSVSNDIDVLMFNFNTGLPGLYKNASDSLDINNNIGSNKISITLENNEFDVSKSYGKLSDKRVFVFIQPNNADKFYRTHAFFIGFDKIPDIAYTPQNIVATYLSAIDCPEYTAKNLIDDSFDKIDSEHIATNFAAGYFYFIHKDNAFLFNKGQLVTNRTYSTNQKVDAAVDIFILKKAVAKLTKRRQ